MLAAVGVQGQEEKLGAVYAEEIPRLVSMELKQKRRDTAQQDLVGNRVNRVDNHEFHKVEVHKSIQCWDGVKNYWESRNNDRKAR